MIKVESEKVELKGTKEELLIECGMLLMVILKHEEFPIDEVVATIYSAFEISHNEKIFKDLM